MPVSLDKRHRQAAFQPKHCLSVLNVMHLAPQTAPSGRLLNKIAPVGPANDFTNRLSPLIPNSSGKSAISPDRPTKLSIPSGKRAIFTDREVLLRRNILRFWKFNNRDFRLIHDITDKNSFSLTSQKVENLRSEDSPQYSQHDFTAWALSNA